ncbi:MAG: response regulator transcription factor [Dehalococcoidia bacterium]|nr:MAG: response regulator transcription factor [Dehalococcoidia bacterium]
MEPVRVLVVDDHALFRRGIVTVLANQKNISVVGEAVNGLEAIDKAEELVPDVIVMDLNMPQCSGLEATQALQAKMPQVSILVLTVSDNEADLFHAIKFGATGYILKNTEPEELVQAIHHIAQGGVILSPMMAAKLLTEFRGLGTDAMVKKTAEEEDNLSPREDEVLRLVSQGATNKEIADSLFISENTVKTHLRNIMDKLHLANRSQAAAYAVKRGLVPDNRK